MAKNTLPKIAPINYATAKTEQTFIDFVVKNNSSTHYNLHGNLANLPMGLQIIIKDINSKHTFSSTDTATLGTFTATIDNFLSCNDRIGNFFTPTSIDLPSLFNEMMAWNNYLSFKKALKLPLKREQKNALVSLFSIVKHCQDPDNYPIGYPFWKNISSHYFSQKRDYDVLCGFYKKTIPSTDTPKHLHFAAYMHQLAINLANALAPNINSYTNDDIKSIFNIPDYDAVMGFLRSKTKKVPTPTPTTTPNSTLTPTTFSSDSDSSHPLNLILYGPPGTGKTYNTLFHALAIIKNTDVKKLQKGVEDGTLKYDDLKKEYDTYVKSGQIVFTTFHQSMSYEDFIEGIKPIPDEINIKAEHKNNTKSKTTLFGDGTTTIKNLSRMKYEVKDGVFRQICKDAGKSYKISHKIVLTDVIDYFCFDLEKTGKVIECSKSGTKYRINKIKTKKDGVYDTIGLTNDNNTSQTIKVQFIRYNYENYKKGIIKDHTDIQPSRSSKSKTYGNSELCYGLLERIKDFEVNRYPQYTSGTLNTEVTGKQNYVLIIDEINRGNVAQIFGELITLIEPSKRLGNSEEMKAILPYSSAQKGEPEYFGVPNNLYIIGTMNTADRSVEALDTALRRRFSFEEMMPDPELLKDDNDQFIEVCGVKLSELLKTINDRIVALKDREHQIGHSYFMGCETEDDLKNVFKDKIIPLLQEYFYGDYKKIYYVLGPGFVEKKTGKTIFAVDVTNDGFDFDIPEEKYEIKTESFDIQQAIKDLKVQS